jgi:hypothetical protein
MTTEEQRAKFREYTQRYRNKHPEKSREYQKKNREKNKEKKKEYMKVYREKNKEKIKEEKKKYEKRQKRKREENLLKSGNLNNKKISKKILSKHSNKVVTKQKRKGALLEIYKIFLIKEENKKKKKSIDKERAAEYYKKNQQKLIDYSKNYQIENKDRVKQSGIEYRKRNRETINLRTEINYWRKKDEILAKREEQINRLFEILGNKCTICGKTDKEILTIDHIKNNGYTERKKFKGKFGIVVKLNQINWDEKYIQDNYQILCWNHNCAKKSRNYMDMPEEKLSRAQKRYSKLWREGLDFFGPCEICGEKDIKFLTIDHVNGDGGCLRKTGEPKGAELLAKFKKNNWPKEIKKHYRFLCYNCNYRQFNRTRKTEQDIKDFFKCLCPKQLSEQLLPR